MQKVQPATEVAGDSNRLFWVTVCPHCRSKQTFRHDGAYSRDNGKVEPRYSVFHFITCLNCRHSSFGWAMTDKADPRLVREYTHFYPQVRPTVPTNLRNEVRKAMEEAAACYSVEAWTATCLMCRRAWELELKGREIGGRNLKSQIDALAAGAGFPPGLLEPAGHSVRFLGNDAAHELDEMTQKNADQAREFIELLFRLLSVIEDAKQLAGMGTTKGS